MGSYLVVANQTLGGDALATHLRRVIDADPAPRFVVLAPVSVPAPVDLGGAMGVMSGIAVIDTATQDQLRAAAQQRLDVLLAWFRDAGVPAEGTVAGDPLAAMDAAVATRSFDEIIVSTLPARLSQWLKLDLVHRASRRFATPVTTVTAGPADQLPAPEPRSPASASAPAPAPPTPAPVPAPAATTGPASTGRRVVMADSVYKIIELVGTSTESWEQAAAAAVAKASQTLRDLRVAEISQLDMVIEDGAVITYRAKVKVSFKYEGDD
jgi:dodecin